ncbi:hypothetical protein WT60_23410 [Burkholderia sp. MSMB617WGS]|uniref:Uncharacterized protein n=1 Tax=Burkholderia savannae TaxID=1637837 RepID=A0ABR5T4X2_9BURK|nr:hypothetical protein WS78_21600 [Burkholderia savannae]AOK49828.1 hypothetical protein WT60_23410 [Burkholderia sp. MSMB617WGS]KVG37178.1 hypothetical protein WS77_23385 [Burkholderia sp. MSMB0265]KVG77803.1 hypothetical protein WS81_18650 [Burkholderia sp. MSMB2040]KVG94237.1 hypothetical protein WS83_00830 [Burkholderia sp. MSMB2042]KVG97722.1 hypothetical protein WS82_28455 [Burkholderia sp. MSMB2041]KVK89797.1 hypothetical protein WS91_28340 [Burkholderia sp. MSMB1498]
MCALCPGSARAGARRSPRGARGASAWGASPQAGDATRAECGGGPVAGSPQRALIVEDETMRARGAPKGPRRARRFKRTSKADE